MQLMRFLFKQVILNPIVLLVLAVLSLIIGGVLVFDAPAYDDRAARAEALQPISAATLADRAPGREVLLEGTISPRAPATYGAFVAYVREEYRSDDWAILGDSSQSWHVVDQSTPPLLIALADGKVRVANDSYTFDSTAFTLTEAEPTLTKGAVQARGYRAGDPILVLGTVVDAGGARAVNAEWVYAGSRAAYLAEMRQTARRSLPIGLALLAVGVLCAAGSVWQLRRALHEIATEQAAEQAALAIRNAAQTKRTRRSS